MMSDHIPTTGQIRGRHNANAMLEPLTWGMADAQFNRWFEAEKRKWQADVLRKHAYRLKGHAERTRYNYLPGPSSDMEIRYYDEIGDLLLEEAEYINMGK